jgi:hypothetical protein
MAQSPAIRGSRPFAGNWRGIGALIFGALAALAFFSLQFDELARLPEPLGTYISIGLTWLPVLLPIAGFSLAIYGCARDRRKTAALLALALNALGLLAAAFILYILTG